jgi:hypothetical protein
MGGVSQEFIKAIYLVWSNGFDHSCDPRCDEQSILDPGSQEELEAASSAGLRCGSAAHLSPGNRGKRPLGDRALVIVPTRHAPTSSFDKDSRARKAPKYCYAICRETGCTRY